MAEHDRGAGFRLHSKEILQLALDAVVRALRATAPSASAVDDVDLERRGQRARERYDATYDWL